MRFVIIAMFTLLSALVSPSYGQTTISTTGIEVLLDNAAIAVEQGNYERAASELERALGIAPKNAEIWHLLGQVRLHQGRYKQAEAMAEKSRTLTSNNSALQQRNAYLIQVARELQGAPSQSHRQIQTAKPSDLPIKLPASPRIGSNSEERYTDRALRNPIPFEPVLSGLNNQQSVQLIYDQYPPVYTNQLPLNLPQQTLPTNLPELIGSIGAALLYAPNQQYGPSQYQPGYPNQLPLNLPQTLPTNLPELIGRIGAELLLQKLNRLETDPSARYYEYQDYKDNALDKRFAVKKTKKKRKHKKKYNKKGYRR